MPAIAPCATLNSTRPLLTPLSSKQAQQIVNVAVEIVAIFMRPRNNDCGVPTFEKRGICSVHRYEYGYPDGAHSPRVGRKSFEIVFI
jgi:hypothetical protein